MWRSSKKFGQADTTKSFSMLKYYGIIKSFSQFDVLPESRVFYSLFTLCSLCVLDGDLTDLTFQIQTPVKIFCCTIELLQNSRKFYTFSVCFLAYFMQNFLLLLVNLTSLFAKIFSHISTKSLQNFWITQR